MQEVYNNAPECNCKNKVNYSMKNLIKKKQEEAQQHFLRRQMTINKVGSKSGKGHSKQRDSDLVQTMEENFTFENDSYTRDKSFEHYQMSSTST